MNILITGATGAIGRELAEHLAIKGNRLFLAFRNKEKGEKLCADIKARGEAEVMAVSLDLADSSSVRSAAGFLSCHRIDAIINNAGVMNGRFILDKDGYEDSLNVNYYNTRLLTELLLPNLEKGAHIVFTTSATRSWFPLQRIEGEITEKGFSRLKAYALSKKLITAYAKFLSEKLERQGIMVNCADPGVVDTPMLRMGKWYDRLTDTFFRPLCLSPEKGAKGALHALSTPLSGFIFTSPSGRKKIRCSRKAIDFIRNN